MPKLSIALPSAPSAAILLVALLVTACGSTSGPSPSGSPGSSGPSSSLPPVDPPGPTVGAIDHKTGATDVLLRLEEGGGFVPIEFNASQAPSFTLYGNGVVVFQRVVTVFPEPDAAGIVHGTPWRTAKLSEDQVQELLDHAIVTSGLGAARESYLADGVADAPNTIFTIRAGGLDKVVQVNALFEQTQPGPDSVARNAFFKLAQRLKDFDRGATIDTDVYQPERFRGLIIEREATPELKPIAWPWPTIKPADFKPGNGAGAGGQVSPRRVMTADEIDALMVPDVAGGLQGPVLKAPDGKLYMFILRPLLVEEME
ncbi:MAG TPA: hypothetical protein VM427_03280 [Patescibacteria group bacterium]|nr:hypothetical protein [Patescibacteria group bacterium]